MHVYLLVCTYIHTYVRRPKLTDAIGTTNFRRNFLILCSLSRLEFPILIMMTYAKVIMNLSRSSKLIAGRLFWRVDKHNFIQRIIFTFPAQGICI